MKKNLSKSRWLFSFLAGTTLLGATASLHADVAPNPTNDYVNSFDAESSRASWLYWYGVNPGNSAILWDAAKDAATNAGSGSLAIELPFGPSGNQQVMFGTFGNGYGYDGSVRYNANQFTNISVDVFVEPGTPVNGAGNFGTLEFSFVISGWLNGGGPFTTNAIIPASATNGWVHLVVPVAVGTLNYDDPGVAGFGFKYTSYSGYPTNTIRFWMDNITARKSGVAPPPPPPPTLSLSRPSPGLNIFAGSAGDYDRQSIRTLQTESGANYSWLGRGTNPVTYSFTISGHPGAGHGGFQTHIFFVPSPSSNNSAPDYVDPTVIMMDLQTFGDGTANWVFRYKTNQPNGNSQLFATPLAQISNPTALGTWSLTFLTDTNVTMTNPAGATTNFTIAPDVAALFPTPLYVYFGVQPNNEGNKGFATTFSRIKIVGTTETLDENFLNQTELDTVSNWSLQSSAPQGIFITPTNTAFLVNWTAANSAGFVLQTNSVLGNTNSFPWSGNGLPAPISLGVLKRTLIATTNLPAGPNAFFRLIK